jgi:hypothetical protein
MFADGGESITLGMEELLVKQRLRVHASKEAVLKTSK